MLNIALVGAPHTGKTSLADGLKASIDAAGWKVTVSAPPWPEGAADLPGCRLALLMGLNTAPTQDASGQAPDSGQTQTMAQAMAQGVADQSIRAVLTQARVPYQVLYGSAEERLALALRSIEHLIVPAADRSPLGTRVPERPPKEARQTAASAWVWACEKCSDPQCEHRLLSDLLAQREQTAPSP